MAQVNFRIDDNVKQEADELFDNLGVSLSAAITIFLKRSIARRGFPFPIVEEPADEPAEPCRDVPDTEPMEEGGDV